MCGGSSPPTRPPDVLIDIERRIVNPVRPPASRRSPVKPLPPPRHRTDPLAEHAPRLLDAEHSRGVEHQDGPRCAGSSSVPVTNCIRSAALARSSEGGCRTGDRPWVVLVIAQHLLPITLPGAGRCARGIGHLTDTNTPGRDRETNSQDEANLRPERTLVLAKRMKGST